MTDGIVLFGHSRLTIWIGAWFIPTISRFQSQSERCKWIEGIEWNSLFNQTNLTLWDFNFSVILLSCVVFCALNWTAAEVHNYNKATGYEPSIPWSHHRRLWFYLFVVDCRLTVVDVDDDEIDFISHDGRDMVAGPQMMKIHSTLLNSIGGLGVRVGAGRKGLE